MLINLYLQGRLDLDGFVSETIDLDGVEEAFQKMSAGEVLHSVVVYSEIGFVATDGIFALDGSEWESPTTSGSSATTVKWSSSTPPTMHRAIATAVTVGG